MRDYIKLVFIFITCFISLIFGVVKHDVINISLNVIPQISTEIYANKHQINDYKSNDNTILKLHTQSQGILSQRNKNQNNIGFGENNSVKKYVTTLFSVKNKNKISFFKSHNMSSYLKNEICTRAP